MYDRCGAVPVQGVLPKEAESMLFARQGQVLLSAGAAVLQRVGKPLLPHRNLLRRGLLSAGAAVLQQRLH